MTDKVRRWCAGLRMGLRAILSLRRNKDAYAEMVKQIRKRRISG